MSIFGLACFGQTAFLDFPQSSFHTDPLVALPSNNKIDNEPTNIQEKNLIDPINKVPINKEFTIWIKSMTFDERDTSEVKISYAEPGKNVRLRTVKKDDEFPSDTYFVIPAKTEVTLTSDHGQETTLVAGSKSSSVITENSQNHCTWWGKIKHRILNPLIPYKSCGKSKRHTISSRGTIFSVSVIGEDVFVDRETGKVEINERVQVNINEDLTINSEEKRELFVTEKSFLNSKKTQKSFIADSVKVMRYDSSEAIENFFKEQLAAAKKILRKSGKNSRLGFKFLDQGELDKGIDHYKKAILNDELNRDVFIQYALLLTEAYHLKDELNNKSTWLEAAFEFIQIEYEFNEQRFIDYQSIGAPEAAKGIQNDFAVATEYYAWGYTVKLKLAGCLENASQNPLKWRLRAIDIKNGN